MSLRPESRSIFFEPQGPLADSRSKTPIIGWYFVSIKPPKKPFLSSISRMFSKPEPYYLFEKDTSHEDFKQAGSQRAEFPLSKIDLNEIIPEEDQSKIQTGGKRSHRKSRSKKSKKSKKSRKVRHH